MRKIHWLILTFIIILAASLRFYKLGLIPGGFHADEASFCYNAYSIMKTGRDEFGAYLPVIIRQLDMWAPALYAYITIPFIALWGLTEFAVRLPTAVFGLLFVPLAFFLTREITHNKEVSLATALLMAISPVQITLSRVQSDPMLTVVLICFGLYLFFLAKRKKSLKLFTLAFIVWLFSLFGHFLSRTFLPIFIPVLLLDFHKEFSARFKIILAALFLVLIIIPTGLSVLGNNGANRYNQLSIFQNPGARLVLEERIREDGQNNVLLTRFFHNKLISFSESFLNNYFTYFRYDFLFNDKANSKREIIPDIGLFYASDLILFMIGLYFLIKKKEPWLPFLLFWILIGPIGPALAVDETPNIHRFLIAVVPILIIMAYGIVGVFSTKSKIRPFIILLFIFLYAYNLSYYLHQYYVHESKHQPWFRNYGYKEMISYVSKIKNNYSKIYTTKSLGNPYIFFLFYWQYDPLTYQRLGSPGDIVYIPSDCPSDLHKKGILYVDKGECEITNTHLKLLKKIRREDDTVAFQLVEYID